MDPYIGKMLDNRYEILELIGRGGMANVYKAKCHRLDRLVAVKILHSDLAQNADFRRRFMDESRAVAQLSHPNIVSVYDVSCSDDVDYIVMELIDGVTLKQYMERRGQMDWREALHFITQIMWGLSHAHSRGVIHRDIKPQNIMVLRDGSVRVADFGIACLADQGQTLTQETLGSVHYISPEQAKGAWVDDRSDLYSLGVVMYEMLTGRTPYDGETPVSVAIQHINGGAPLPSTLVIGIPRGLEQITMHAMASNADERYSSATEMLRDMEEFRKNPSLTFVYGPGGQTLRQAPQAPQQPQQPQHGGMTRSEAERYAAARAANRAARQPDERRAAERARREQEKKRRTVIGVVCAAAAAVVLLVVLGVVLLRGSGTNDKPDTPEVEVPKLVGMKLEDINPDDYPELKIDLNGVTYDYNDEYEKGYVYEQTPKAGEMVKGGRVRTISLKVSLGKENNLMPDLGGQSEANAMSQLKAMNLGLNVRREEESSDTVPAGSVTRTDPAAETELQEGQSVTVYVSLGSGKMPELKNQSKENAKSILDAMNLNLRITYLEEESDDIASGNVTRTVPASDSQLSRGQQVTVYVSKGSGKVTVPPVTGLSVRDAIDLLTENDLKYEIKRVYSDTDEKDRVVRQSEAANSKVAKDTIVTLEVSDGPEPTEAPTTAPTEPEPTTESSESGD